MGGTVAQKNVLYVTAFRDIGRGAWKFYRRPNEEYIKYFLLMAENITGTLLVFLEAGLLEVLSARLSNRKNIIFRPIDGVTTFYDTHMDRERRIMDSKEYSTLIPQRRRGNPEHCVAEYTLLMHSKINFLAEAQRFEPTFDYYAWIDFGFVRDVSCCPKEINMGLLGSKIIYVGTSVERRSRVEMIVSDNIFMSGSSFIVPAELVLRFERLWAMKLGEYQDSYVCDDDQGLVLQIYFDNPELFDLVKVGVSFGLYKNYLNLSI